MWHTFWEWMCQLTLRKESKEPLDMLSTTIIMVLPGEKRRGSVWADYNKGRNGRKTATEARNKVSLVHLATRQGSNCPSESNDPRSWIKTYIQPEQSCPGIRVLVNTHSPCTLRPGTDGRSPAEPWSAQGRKAVGGETKHGEEEGLLEVSWTKT